MAHINEQAAAEGLRFGMSLIQEAMQEDVDAEKVSRQVDLGAFITQKVLPLRGEVEDDHDLVRMAEAKGRQLGFDSLQSMQVFASIFKAEDLVRQRTGAGIGDALKQAKQEIDLARGAIKLREEMKTPEEKAFTELRGEQAEATHTSLTSIRNIALEHLGEGDIIERIDDMASDLDSALGIDLPGYIFQGSKIKTIENLVKYLASQLKTKSAFKSYSEEDLRVQLSALLNDPENTSADKAFKDLVKPSAVGDVISGGAMADLGRVLGGQGL